MNEATKQFYDKIENDRRFLFHHDNVTVGSGKYTRKKHYHNLFEIYYFTGGECNYFIDNKSYQLVPGDIVLIPEGVIHNSEYGNTVHSRMLINCSHKFIPASVRHLLPQMLHLYRNPSIADEVKRIFSLIESEYENPDGFSEDALACYTHMLFILLARNIDKRTNTNSGNACIEQAIDYIKENFTSNINLSDMAKMLYISSEHFSRLFKKETGFNFSEYLNLLRLQKAETMLKKQNATVAQIASECGFNDSNYFSVKFKNMYGITPKQLQLANKK